jgi:mono/diheme cytochrome c family protein/glucose/arabinose dehydrogenase
MHFILKHSRARLAALLIASAVSSLAAPVSLFDGKSLDGWEGETMQVWRVEDGTIAGGSMAGNPRNEFLTTTRSYRNFILRLDYRLVGTEGFVNGGIQFHSQRIADPPHEMAGYQADIGAGYSGFLYDESRRNRVLAAAPEDLVKRIEKPGEWNQYEIRAEGRRVQLFLNGHQTIDYQEDDPDVPQHGRIALQIHGDCKAVIQFRNLTIEELPASPDAAEMEILRRFGDPESSASRPAPWMGRKFLLDQNEVVVFAGQSNFVHEQKAGNLELQLAQTWADKRPRFRSMAWEADTVYEQWRDLNFGSWPSQLRAAGATVVIAQFGQIEALDGLSRLPAFVSAYHRLLDQFTTVTPRIVLVSPMPFEASISPDAPDLTLHNSAVRSYANAIHEIAEQRGLVYVDLFTPLEAATARRTTNGMHLTESGLAEVANAIAKALGNTENNPSPKTLKAAILEKNRLWQDCWRPANWSFVYGDRVSQLYGTAAGDQPSLRELFEAHKPLIDSLDQRIHALALGEEPPPLNPPPVSVASVAEPVSAEPQLASFTPAEGFTINLFASEDLGVVKPVQIAWDERGRLFVACSPTYPQTLPGIAPGDFILMLEDTDGNGQADRSTRFAEGLTMVQGVEPGRGGLYVCDFDRIVHFTDADGDGYADHSEVVLSGFGVGDTHQLVNSITHGPDGTLWFTQGLHAFSRIETPWGISRLDQSGIWRFNPRTLRLDGFFNHAAAGHNCWGVAFDNHGQIFHKSGDRPHGYYSLPGLIRIADPQDYHPVATLFESNPKTTALDFIGTRAMPDDLQGAAVVGGFMGSLIELHRLDDDGAGFTSKQLPRLLVSSDDTFRPVDVSMGPDGALYVADWCNPAIGHYQTSYASPERDRVHGRIWRISAIGREPVRQPDLASMSADELMQQLASGERWTRYQAKRLLFDAPREEVLHAADVMLSRLDPNNESDGQLLIGIAGIYQSHQSPRAELLTKLRNSSDPAVRACSARVAGDWKVAHHLEDAVNDPHPRVRLEAIVAASYLEAPEGVAIALQALDHPRDRFIDYALRHSLLAQKPWWPDETQLDRLAVEHPDHASYLNELGSEPKTIPHPGQIVYQALCLNCHQPDGKGLPGLYPALTSNARVSGDPASVIKILLHGFDSSANLLSMPPMGLDDRQTADVINYVRTNFANHADPVTAEQVQAIRQQHKDHRGFWKPEELSE